MGNIKRESNKKAKEGGRIQRDGPIIQDLVSKCCMGPWGFTTRLPVPYVLSHWWFRVRGPGDRLSRKGPSWGHRVSGGRTIVTDLVCVRRDLPSHGGVTRKLSLRRRLLDAVRLTQRLLEDTDTRRRPGFTKG